MRPAHPLEQSVGMAYYASDADGTGGHIRHEPADFRVREIEAVETKPASADPGAYPHLVLRVELTRWDTNDFAGALADRLGISRERVSWAGTKDKHAVTTQLFSVEGIDPGAVPEVSGAEVTAVGRTGRPVLFGDLLGNEFEIVVREAERPAAVDEVSAQLRALGRQGSPPNDARVAVPNFFGQQRFGSRRPVTHEVGLAIVRRDWEGAVLAYVGSPHEREPEETREARSFVESSRDWQAALDRFPNHLGFERAMLHRLDERTDGGDAPPTSEDFRAALQAVPENIQQLFVHAAQSVLFNRVLSRRMERGLPFRTPVEGDVVCFADEESTDDLVVPDADRSQAVTADRLDTVRRHCERNRAVVTAPLIGTETTLASGEPGEIEREVLEEADLSPTDFDLPEPFHSSGTRRAVAVRTDVDVSRDPLTLAFALPKGSYATVLLREYLKVDPERL